MRIKLLLNLTCLFTLLLINVNGYSTILQDTLKSNIIYKDSTILLKRNSYGNMDTLKYVYTTWNKDGEGENYVFYQNKSGNWIAIKEIEHSKASDGKTILIESRWDSTSNAFINFEKRIFEEDTAAPQNNSLYSWNKGKNEWYLVSSRQTKIDDYKRTKEEVDISLNSITGVLDTLRTLKCSFTGRLQTCIEQYLDSIENRMVNKEKTETGTDSSGISIEAHYTFDPYSGEWVGIEKKEALIDSEGNDVMRATYIWNIESEEWQGDNKTENRFDSLSKTQEQIYYYWNSIDKKWDYMSRIVSKKNKQSVPIYIAYYTYYDTETQKWIGSSKTETAYDEHSNLLSEINADWDDSANDWHNYEMSTYEYDQYSNNTFTRFYTWNDNTNSWKLNTTTTHEMTLNNMGKPLQTEEYLFNETQQRRFSISKYTYTYNSQNLVAQETKYNWDNSKSDWEINSKNDLRYYEDGTVIYEKKYEYNGESWIGSYFQETLIDPTSQQITYINYEWKNEINDFSYKTYDTIIDIPSKNFYVAKYHWDDERNRLVGDVKQYRQYNEFGNLIKQGEDYWDYPSEKWKPKNQIHKEYFEDTKLPKEIISSNLLTDNTYGLISDTINYYSKHPIIADVTGPLVDKAGYSVESILIYPNPAIDYIYIEGKDIQNTDIFDMTGLHEGNYAGSLLEISHLHPGSHILVMHGLAGDKRRLFIKK